MVNNEVYNSTELPLHVKFIENFMFYLINSEIILKKYIFVLFFLNFGFVLKRQKLKIYIQNFCLSKCITLT